MDAKLLPCPFCGGAASYIQGCWYVRCDDCGAETASYELKADAANAWNIRLIPETNETALELWNVLASVLLAAKTGDYSVIDQKKLSRSAGRVLRWRFKAETTTD